MAHLSELNFKSTRTTAHWFSKEGSLLLEMDC